MPKVNEFRVFCAELNAGALDRCPEVALILEFVVIWGKLVEGKVAPEVDVECYSIINN